MLVARATSPVLRRAPLYNPYPTFPKRSPEQKKSRAASGTDPARWSPVARVVASQIPAPSARARRITACDSRESSQSNLQENRAPTAKNRQIRLLKRTQSSSPFNGFLNSSRTTLESDGTGNTRRCSRGQRALVVIHSITSSAIASNEEGTVR